MGTSGSKSKGKPLLGGDSKGGRKKGGDDGLIGNRKVRTIILSILLIIFFAFGVAYFLALYDYYDNWSSGVLSFTCGDSCTGAKNAYGIIIGGSFTSIGFAIAAILLFLINCDDKCGRLAGIGLIVGGIMYAVGWWYYIGVYNDTIDRSLLNDDQEERLNAQCMFTCFCIYCQF